MKKVLLLNGLFILVVSFSSWSNTDENNLLDPIVTKESAIIPHSGFSDDHAPIAVMGDHSHSSGEWMFSLRYGHMYMSDHFSGTDKVSNKDIFKLGYKMVPQDMSVSMFMGGVMYGLNDRLTLMLMASFVTKNMSMLHSNNPAMDHKDHKKEDMTKSMDNTHHHNHDTVDQSTMHNMSSQGFGDVKLSGIVTLYKSPMDKKVLRSLHHLLLQVGLSFPTGSIKEGGENRYPYPMQLGSGTVDPIFSLTYTLKRLHGSLGMQVTPVFRFMENELNYTKGSEYKATAWLAYNILQKASVSCRMEYKNWENIKGIDKTLDVKKSPAARSDLGAGQSVKLSIGINLYQDRGSLSGNRLGLEFGIPLYQNLDGPQMGLNYYITAGWQWSL